MRNPFSSILKWYFTKKTLPYWCLLALDFLIVLISALVTCWIVKRSNAFFAERFTVIYTSLLCAAMSIIGARVFRTYSGVIRYSSFVDLSRVGYASALSLVLTLIVTQIAKSQDFTPFMALTNKQLIFAFAIATLFMWAVRVIVKTLFDLTTIDKKAIRVMIFGIKSGGVGLAKSIRNQVPKRFLLKGFITTDEKSKNLRLMGEKVYVVNDKLPEVLKNNRIEGVLISPLRVKEFRANQALQDLFISNGVKIFMTSQVKEASIENGQLTEEDFKGVQLNEVSVEDLLPRDEIKVDMESVGRELKGKNILITGSAGSIGSEMVRLVAAYKPAAMMLIDQAETPQHDIRLMMARDYPDIPAETIVASIARPELMEDIFQRFRPDYVFHAAAYKHVPMMEDNPSVAVQNNIYGTKVIADLADKYGVKKFVMVSTDKAVNPTNVMGCSKRICEIYVQSLSKQSKTQFVTTRFGNVLGSNGSVIPLFREQIKNGGPVTVTDERIVRFFMLIPEACKLVLEAGTKGKGGEIFVFDMGEPVKIVDLAKRMIALSGAKGVEIRFTGLREGEKLYEEVLNELEGTKPTFHEKIRIAQVREYDYEQVCKDIDNLIDISKHFNNMDTVRKMKQIVPEYKSNNSVYEEIDKELEK